MEYRDYKQKSEFNGRSNITFYQADCMDMLSQVPDNYYQLCIVDPPYGINASKGTWGSSNKGRVKDYGKKDWDKKLPTIEYFSEIKRVSVNQIIWGGNHFGNMDKSSCWIVWDKQKTGNFADCELAYTSFDSAVRKFTYRWNGMLQENMKNKEIRIHPTQKPVALYKWLLEKYAKPDDKILDTHFASGSIAIAFRNLKYDLEAYEIDKEYYEKH